MPHDETLLLRPLADGAVEAVFEFRDSWQPEPSAFCASGDTNALCHFDGARFPRVLAEVVDEFDVAEMHVALTRGRWDRGAWGHSAADDTHGPDGAEMWAKLPVRSDRSTVARWAGLRAALSGLLCASLERLSPSRVSRTRDAPAGFELWRGTLPRESACVENLAAWVGFSPCRKWAGLGALLRPERVFASEYHSLALRVTRGTSGTGSRGSLYELRLTVTMVARRALVGASLDFTLAPVFAPPRNAPETLSFTRCPLASSSAVLTLLPSWLGDDVAFATPPDEIVPVEAGAARLAVHRLNEGATLVMHDRGSAWFRARGSGVLSAAPAEIEQHAVQQRLTWIGSGDRTRGALDVWLATSGRATLASLRVEIPDLVVPFLYTATLECHPGTRNQTWWRQPLLELGPGPARVQYTAPGALADVSGDRARGPSIVGAPGTIELTDLAFAGDRGWARLRLEFETRFLPMGAWPPDPFRGFDWPPAVATFGMSDGSCATEDARVSGVRSPLVHAIFEAGTRSHRIYSDGALLQLPEFDFSMPFNVVTLQSTLLALFFGTIMSGLVRKSGRGTAPRRPIFAKIAERLRRRKRRV